MSDLFFQAICNQELVKQSNYSEILIKNKIFNFAHTETAGIIGDVENLSIEHMIENKVGLVGQNYVDRFEYVKIDDYFPQYISNNLDQWKDKIIPNAEKTVEDLYE